MTTPAWRLFSHKITPSRNESAGALATEARFELHQAIAQDGMRAIHRARQVPLDRLVAIKMLLPERAKEAQNQDTFIAEALVTGELDHPNIIPVYELGKTEDGMLFYAMKEVQGRSWSEVLREKTETENLEILMAVSDAVAFAHDRGYLHRDLKPENVMLGNFGEVLVMDWGLAVTTKPEGKAERITEGMPPAGTPAYMAPEMAGAEGGRLGPWSDIYLLGAILYEIVTGLKAHQGEDVNACMRQARTNQIQPTDKTGELVDIALKAMATDPKERFASVKAFQAAIKTCQDHAESIMLCERAAAELKIAEHEKDYERYARAVHGYRQSLDLWGENRRAAGGLSRAQFAYAQCGYEKGDLDLAASLLDDHVRQHRDLLKLVRTSIQAHAARKERLKRLTRLAIAAGVVIVLGAVGAAVWIAAEQRKTASALVNAQRAKALATEKEGEATRALVSANQEREKVVAANLAQKVKTLHANLLAKNPEYASDGKFRIEDGEVVEADFSASRLDHIGPLKDLRLRKLDISGTRIWDLTPIVEHPITVLNLQGTGVSQMAPVAKLRQLEELRITALRHLEGLDGVRRMAQPMRISGSAGEGPMPAVDFWKRYDEGLYCSEFQREYAKKHNLPLKRVIKLEKGERLTLILIPPGEFMMGASDEGEEEKSNLDADNRPQHLVKITRPYYLGVWEVTQGQMVAAKITSQSWFRSTSDAAQRPAELLGWTEITRDHLNRFQKYAPRGMVFRLPTEAEWEYACRAGTTTRFHFGETLNSDQANCAFKHSDYSASTTAQTRHRNRGETTVCGLYEPNAWGLHDMHGNVAEWCQDIYNKKWYEKSPQTDPLYTGDGPMRVYRGGGYDFAAGDWQSSARSKKEFSSSQGNLGFRLVLSFSPKER